MVVRPPVSTTQPATQTVDLTADSSPLIIRPKKPRKQKQKSRHQRTKLSKLQLTKPESEPPLPEGISRSTFPTVEDGKQMSSTVMMTRQLKAYHAKFEKKIKIYNAHFTECAHQPGDKSSLPPSRDTRSGAAVHPRTTARMAQKNRAPG